MWELSPLAVVTADPAQPAGAVGPRLARYGPALGSAIACGGFATLIPTIADYGSVQIGRASCRERVYTKV